MKKSLLVIFGLAAVAGLLTFSLLTGFVQPQDVVVTKYDLAAGTRLTADLLEIKRVPKGGIAEGSYFTVEEVVGKVLTTARVAGDPVTAYVAGDGLAAAGIPAQLEPNHVAMAVKIDQATGLAGIVRAGQRVSVIAIIDPQAIQRDLASSRTALMLTPAAGAAETGDSSPTPIPTATPTPTPQPPLSPVASITIKGLRVLVVPQAFRYEELPGTAGEAELFASARTSQSAQQGSVVLLEVPVEPVEIAAGLIVSPAELLALLNEVAALHLVLEPSEGLEITLAAFQPVDLANLYEKITGYELNR